MSNKKFVIKSLYDALWHTSPGSTRRKAIIKALYESSVLGSEDVAYISSIPVNCKWQLSSKDPDLKALLKKKLLIQKRQGGIRNQGNYPLGWKNSSKRQTELFLGELQTVKSFLGEI